MSKAPIIVASIASLVCLNPAIAAMPSASAPKRVAILLFDGAEIIDYSGPWEVFGAEGYDVVSVARTKTPVTTAGGEVVVPQYDFSDAPNADIVLVPGGDVSKVRKDPEALAWVRKETARDQHTMSVCNGSLILADAGLLDGLSATATYHWIPTMRTQYPRIHMVDDQRWVDNGKIITTAGLSAGIDGALHLVEVMDGRGAAEQVALSLEYDWRPAGGFVRGKLAETHIPHFDTRPIGEWRVLETSGGESHWLVRAEGNSTKSAAEILQYVERNFHDQGQWTRDTAATEVSPTLSHWRLSDRNGARWKGTLSVAHLKGGAAGRYAIGITVERAS